jgi:hypothetical protein
VTAVLVASDLDQTLVFSPRAAARGPSRPSRVVEVLDGRTISLLSHDTERDLVELDRSAVLVPSTTRTRAQFARIDLPFASRYAVVASGAVVLVDGEPDVDWSRAVAARLREASAPLTALQDLFTGYGGREWLLRVRDADDVFLVAAVDADLLAGDELDLVSAGCTELGWRAVHQGRKLYVLPSGLDKAAAVQHVADRVAAEAGSAPLVLAAGDTELDWGMLRSASHGWVPAGSELDRLGLSAPHVTRTDEAGLAASEQIVAECLAHVARARATDRVSPPAAGG